MRLWTVESGFESLPPSQRCAFVALPLRIAGSLSVMNVSPCRRLPLGVLAVCVFAVLGCLLPEAAAGEDRRKGFYAGLQIGAVFPTDVNSVRRYVSHPTRCDSLLYPPSVSPPVDDPACRDSRPGSTFNEFDPGAGPAGGFMAGYDAGRLRYEVEYLNAAPGNAESPVGRTTSSALATKTSEWSAEQPPFEWIGDKKVHQLFANVYYDFLNDSRWTPFVGAGIGWADVELNYYLQFIRKPLPEYLEIEFDPDWPEVAKRAAAGTASILDTYPNNTVFGYQALAGVDYALSERTSLGVMLRWVSFDDIEHEAVYDLLRSHAGVLADGVTPFNNELTFSDFGYQALTVNLKYHF